MKTILSLLLVCFTGSLFAQELQAPETFLGYKIGTKYTRHHQIEAYAKHVSSTATKTVVFEKYGETNEGRPLFILIISSPENIANLAAIRQNNCDLTTGKSDKENQPTIVWLSYNVHGNEPSSSEAALLTMYELAAQKNEQAINWLKNTVIIIDPCLNPDGRDRYVNGFNTAVGHQANPHELSREHKETWPSGRSNHYLFDLNRDWAWQTQVESQQRAVIYQKWYPHVHVDFHEQGCDEPYYFAPAAEPIHATITPWQREFQTKVGINHTRYFDKEAWLYFTKERFDLLYPSYGDTYPMYNGAIGMTYEQGGIGGGLAIIDETYDTLTLVDRVQHHFTTSLSTIETASTNAADLVKNFKKYYADSRKGSFATYKTYLLTAQTEQELAGIKTLLQKNNIEYGTVKENNIKAFDYQSKKEGVFVSDGYVLAISTQQAHGVLANVLLEPVTTVSDSNTYDITAWSLPYAYGVKGYATKTSLSIQTISEKQAAPIASSYGYLIPHNSFQSAKVLAQLLKAGIKIHYNEKPFKINDSSYSSGNILVLRTVNSGDWSAITQRICAENHVQVVALTSGYVQAGSDFGSPDVKIIAQAPRVATLTGEDFSSLSVGEIWSYFDNELHYPITQIPSSYFHQTNLAVFDVLIIPSGDVSDLITNSEKLAEFAARGGTIIALEGSVNQFAQANKFNLTMKQIPEDTLSFQSIPTYANRERAYLSTSIPGAIYEVHLDKSHPLCFGLPRYYDLKQSTDLVNLSKDSWNVGSIQTDSYVTGFVGYKAKQHLSTGMVFGASEIGNGSFIYFVDSPLFRNFWESGKVLFSNAVFFHGK